MQPSTENWQDTGQPQIGVCQYSFQLPLNSTGVSIAYAIEENAQYAQTLQRATSVVSNAVAYRTAKTYKMNHLLNNLVPYFRCSDRDIVKVYYYLWSVNLMLYIDVGKGIENMPHTQSAANNFLGMHRFDGVFQIMVGAWTNPKNHTFWANGNPLIWENVYRANLTDQLVRPSCGLQLPDNFGIAWGSGVFGPEVIAHVLGACDIYEHSGALRIAVSHTCTAAVTVFFSHPQGI